LGVNTLPVSASCSALPGKGQVEATHAGPGIVGADEWHEQFTETVGGAPLAMKTGKGRGDAGDDRLPQAIEFDDPVAAPVATRIAPPGRASSGPSARASMALSALE
jgi:hypothetical protein